ncbi:hypothetical protein Ms3S1_36870 [Methylosinus sp. 3S-1]|uniref:Uncharacterized protein n=1 Tax=Methylosinus trichosporium (strain ATCC 35070 / NCIMB 11131 / UNIQEM 75 / OB3b) TaxID=595536 RepID=A0A2D2D3X2_METT3|nr:hypothetical protein CQW49_18665 [Methylosinus trichosporium OB3b]OBS51235.1 hypothetical protein A8B73_17430 [Methylosinus sp. 3S-1]
MVAGTASERTVEARDVEAGRSAPAGWALRDAAEALGAGALALGTSLIARGAAMVAGAASERAVEARDVEAGWSAPAGGALRDDAALGAGALAGSDAAPATTAEPVAISESRDVETGRSAPACRALRDEAAALGAVSRSAGRVPFSTARCDSTRCVALANLSSSGAEGCAESGAAEGALVSGASNGTGGDSTGALARAVSSMLDPFDDATTGVRSALSSLATVSGGVGDAVRTSVSRGADATTSSGFADAGATVDVERPARCDVDGAATFEVSRAAALGDAFSTTVTPGRVRPAEDDALAAKRSATGATAAAVALALGVAETGRAVVSARAERTRAVDAGRSDSTAGVAAAIGVGGTLCSTRFGAEAALCFGFAADEAALGRVVATGAAAARELGAVSVVARPCGAAATAEASSFA